MKGNANMSKEKSFWTTLPGILTGVASILSSIAVIFGTLYTMNIIGNKKAGKDIISEQRHKEQIVSQKEFYYQLKQIESNTLGRRELIPLIFSQYQEVSDNAREQFIGLGVGHKPDLFTLMYAVIKNSDNKHGIVNALMIINIYDWDPPDSTLQKSFTDIIRVIDIEDPQIKPLVEGLQHKIEIVY